MTSAQAAEMLRLLREIRDLLTERGSAQPEEAPKNFAEPLYPISHGVAPAISARSWDGDLDRAWYPKHDVFDPEYDTDYCRIPACGCPGDPHP